MRRLGTLGILLAVILLGIAVRVPAHFLPAVPEEKQELFRDETGEPYLTEQDSYYYLRQARTMAEEGRIFLFSSRAEDPMVGGGPAEETESAGDPMLLPVIALCVWKLLSLLFPVTLSAAASWTGPVLGSLAAVPAFLYVKKRSGTAGAAGAGILAGIAIPFTGHTYAGFFDTDCLLALLPLGFVTLEMRAVQEDRLLRQVCFALGSAVCFMLLSLTWTAYYVYFWLMVTGGVISLLLILFVSRGVSSGKKRKAARGLGLTILFTLALLLLVRGPEGAAAPFGVLTALRGVTGEGSAFPYTHRFTREMQPLAAVPNVAKEGIAALLTGGTSSVLSRAGGLIPCLAALAALPMTVMRARRKKGTAQTGEDPVPALPEAGFLIPWLAAGVILTLSWQRCAEVMVLPLALLAGMMTGAVQERTLCGIQKEKPLFRRTAAWLLAAAVCIPVIAGSWRIARDNVPGVSDPQAQAMEQIRETEPEDAVIASWWDDGYFMQYAARRRTAADGGTSRADVYWFLGKALLTEDPAQMAGIFRMLETSGVTALETLKDSGVPEGRAATLLARIAGKNRAEAERVLAEETELGGTERTTLLDRTHPAETRPLLLVLGSDLLDKLQAVSCFGTWNPETGKQERFSYWYASEASRPVIPGTTCLFEMNGSDETLEIRISDDGKPELVRDPKNMYYNASSLSLWKDGACVTEQTLEGTGPAVILLEDHGRLCAFSCDAETRKTMLVRLLVCGEKNIPGTEEAGTWFGAANGDECPVQSLLNAADRAAVGVRVWRLAE